MSTTERVVDAFRERGFEYQCQLEDGWFKLVGKISPIEHSHAYRCEVEIDPTFRKIPRIRLLESLPGLPNLVPHLGPNGELCYLDSGSVILDIFDPVGQSLACLETAQKVLGSILQGEMREDLAEEFWAYWRGAPCWVDAAISPAGHAECLVFHCAQNRTSFFVVTDDRERQRKRLASLPQKFHVKKVIELYRVKCSIPPRPWQSAWPISNVVEFLSWLGTIDKKARKEATKGIEKGYSEKLSCAIVMVESPRLIFGVLINYDYSTSRGEDKRPKHKNPMFGMTVVPMSFFRIDSEFVVQRNIPDLTTLTGKSIAVVGCGTIGGFLAEMLTKAGAGSGDGRLVLVDPDYLMPENIGRHRLGVPSLLAPKARAMMSELLDLMPGTNIVSHDIDVKDVSLVDCDLIIDATGEEALGHWLTREYASRVPILSVWIEGAGVAVRGLLHMRDAGGACYRCLWHAARKGDLVATVPEIEPTLRGHGCGALFVPFSASVSVQAASLGLEMALDWVNEKPSPSLRTKVIDRSFELATPDCDPSSDPNCPICNS